jgi:hypothetical protein
MARFYAVPIKNGPYSTEPDRTRWYVEKVGGPTWPLLGPYASMEAAEFAAETLNREEK